MQVREKVGKSRFTVFFQWFVVPEGRKVGSLKRRARSHLAKWEMKSCTPLRHEAHLQVKKLKTLHVRSTFGSWHVEKVHAVVARSTFQSQNVKKTPNVWTTFGRSDVVLRGRRKGFCTLSKASKTWGFCSSFNYNHHYITHHSTTLHYTTTATTTTTTLTLHNSTLHYTNYITLHYTPLDYITLHYT